MSDSDVKLIQDLDDEIFEGEDTDPIFDEYGAYYDEPISESVAQSILGDSFISGRDYKLITMNEGLVLVSTDPKDPEDTFEYALDEDDPGLQSYADMMYTVHEQDPIPQSSVEPDDEPSTTSDFLFKACVITLILMIIVGIGAIIYLLNF